MNGHTWIDAVEMGVHFAPFIALGAAAVFYKVKWYFAEKRRLKEEHRQNMAADVAAKKRQSERNLQRFKAETYAEMRQLRPKSSNCRIIGCMGAAVTELPEGERAAVISGRYAKTQKIRGQAYDKARIL